MKTSSFLALLLANTACTVVAANAPGGGMAAGNDAATRGFGPLAGNGTCAIATTGVAPLALSPAAQAALLFQIEEERMARELYLAFNARWGLRPFARIPEAEARHESALKQLAARAGVVVPDAVAGRFVSAEVQQRYDALLSLGLGSSDDALRAAAFVEEQDIADLRTLAASTDSVDLGAVARALEQGSGRHLGAFVGALAMRGITYVPQVLSGEDYLSASSAVAGRGRGAGSGPGRQGFRGGR